MSGIGASDEAMAEFQSIKNKKFPWGVFEIKTTDTSESVELKYKAPADDSSDADAWANFESKTWADIVTYIEENLTADPAYIVVDFKFNTNDRDQQKLILLSWLPEKKLKVKKKMLHGSTLNSLKEQFNGIQGKPVTATDAGEIEYAEVFKEIN